MTHDEAFSAAYGSTLPRRRKGVLQTRETDDALQRASICIRACDGLPMTGLKDGGIRQLSEACRVAVRLLDGRLANADPEAGLVRAQLMKAMRTLDIR